MGKKTVNYEEFGLTPALIYHFKKKEGITGESKFICLRYLEQKCEKVQLMIQETKEKLKGHEERFEKYWNHFQDVKQKLELHENPLEHKTLEKSLSTSLKETDRIRKDDWENEDIKNELEEILHIKIPRKFKAIKISYE